MLLEDRAWDAYANSIIISKIIVKRDDIKTIYVTDLINLKWTRKGCANANALSNYILMAHFYPSGRVLLIMLKMYAFIYSMQTKKIE